ncbi:MAG TPA: putative 2-dehydropantoate 2-reductase [Pontiellaceae bacterium]|nr:putative 2-dehydropantoate 2-reductase [Pontiellaceae bacterium]
MKRFAIIGTGAVGGYYGALLQRAGFDVHFLLHSDYEFVKENGLTVESVNGDFRLPQVHAYNDPQQMPRCDVVIVALKTTANHQLKTILLPVVKDDGVVLTLQNGLGSEEEIAAIAGSGRVLGGLCFLCSNKVGPGHIHHLDYGLITLGEYLADGLPGGITPRLERLGSAMTSAGIKIDLIGDLPTARWRKLVWNIPFNGLSVAKNCLTDALMNSPETRALCRTMMEEVAAASAVCARPIEPEFIEKMMTYTEKMEPYAPSMKLDFDRGNPMEIESIYGNPIRAAKAAGVEMPETEKLYWQLVKLNPAR